MTSFFDRFRKRAVVAAPAPTFLIEPISAPMVEQPASFLVQPTPTFTAPPPPPKPVSVEKLRFTVAKPRGAIRIRPLRKLAYTLIAVNVGVALLFTSNNMTFNAALYAYMATSTALMAHYLSITR